jgi:hypothetical protein
MAEMYVSDVSPAFTDGCFKITTTLVELELLSTALPSSNMKAIRDVPVTRFLEDHQRLRRTPSPNTTAPDVSRDVSLLSVMPLDM